MIALLFAAQAAPADIALHATVDVRAARVESSGRARISAHAEPDGGSSARSSGTVKSRHFELQVDARIAAAEAVAADETTPTPPR